MNNINIQRTQSLLVELIPEALWSLNDSRINSIPITAVDCKKGKYDAVVYFDGSDFDKEELKVITSLLNKASSRIKSFCLASTSWYKCPNFRFVVDDTIEKNTNLEALFAQIKREKQWTL